MSDGTPAAEFEIDEALVRALLRRQHPDLAERPLRPAGSGWDNAMWRLGEDRVVRLPRREAAASLVRHEQRVLPAIASALPVPVPVPERIGHPDPATGYPWFFSVQTWIEGEEALDGPLDPSEAPRLAAFLRALHRPAPHTAPPNPYRGIPLEARRAVIEGAFDALRNTPDRLSEALEGAWTDALRAPVATERVWLHADLHPRNVLTREGRLAGIIDWGDVTSGDAAYDLACLWLLLHDPAARAAALRCYAPDEALRIRAIGSAVGFGAVLLAKGRTDDPRLVRIGQAALRNVAADLD